MEALDTVADVAVNGKAPGNKNLLRREEEEEVVEGLGYMQLLPM